MTIRDCEEADGGSYEVQVRNVHATEVSRANITIGDVRAHFLAACPEHVALFVGEELSLECELSDMVSRDFNSTNMNVSNEFRMRVWCGIKMGGHCASQSACKCCVLDLCGV